MEKSSLDHLSPQLQKIINDKITKAKKQNINAITFKFCGIGERTTDIKDEHGNPMERYFTGSIAPECTINDPWAKENEDSRKYHVVLNGTKMEKDHNGKSVYVPDAPHIQFTKNGFLPVSLDNKLLLARMFFADENRYWKYRNQTVRPMWEEVKIDHTQVANKNIEMIVESRAIDIANNMPIVKLKEYYAALLGQNGLEGKKSDEIKHDIFSFIKSPGGARGFMGCNADPKIKAELKIKDAMSIGHISCNYEERSWSVPGSKDKKPFLTFDIDKNPEQALIDFLISDKGVKIYEELCAIFEIEELV